MSREAKYIALLGGILLVSVLIIAGVIGAIGSLCSLEVYTDGYTEVEYPPRKFSVIEDFSQELKTTSATYAWSADPMLCSVAFLAMPPETVSGESWLNEIYDTTNQQFNCVNKNVQFSTDGEYNVIKMSWEFDNGEGITRMVGVSRENELGAVMGLMTLRVGQYKYSLAEELAIRMISSVRLIKSPENYEMLDSSGVFTAYHLKLTDESMCVVYGFQSGENSNDARSLSSTLPGVESKYYLKNSAEGVQKYIENWTATEMQDLEDHGMQDVVLEQLEYLEDQETAFVVVKYKNAAKDSVDGGTEEADGGCWRIYKVMRLTEEELLCWRLTVDSALVTSDSESAAIQMMYNEGVEITLA